MEIWKDIAGYERIYQVSNLGNVKRISMPHMCGGGKYWYTDIRHVAVTQHKDRAGYLRVALSRKGKGKHTFVHRLVAKAFLPNENNYPIVNHKDGNPKNNKLDNLEWCTQSQNIIHARDVLGRKMGVSRPLGKSNAAVKVACYKDGAFINKYDCLISAAIDLGVSHKGISNVLNGWSKTAYGYWFERLN